MQCVRELDASAVMVNDHTARDWMPLAGRRHSGYGIGGIGYTITDMTQEKMTVICLWRGFSLRPHYARHQANLALRPARRRW